MTTSRKRIVGGIATIGGAIILVLGIALAMRGEKAESWTAHAEGFLAVATPCCYRASLWDSLGDTTPDDQRARPASAAEAVRWLDDWPYRDREAQESADEAQLTHSMQSREVRCVGPRSGDDIPQRGDDEETASALRNRLECSYAKWRVWSEETANGRPNERHTIWADEDGFFHGRVDHWKR